ncbi:MAG TPA: hypothetical protein VNB24_04435 [Acidimicrobiales bacterium]|nr:hypothetical protein [Acidimicrobiales bacterium]
MTTPRRTRLVVAVVAVASMGIMSAPGASAQETTSSTRPPRESAPSTRPPREQPRERPRERPPGDGERRAMAMDEVKSRCLHQIQLRHEALANVKRRMARARFVTDEHEAALVQNIDATAASLSRLADVIQGEDNFEELRAECRSIVDDHRVFVLVIPRVRLVLASDAALGAAGRLTTAADHLQTEIDKAKSGGKDTAEAERDLARMRTHIATARDQASGVYGAVINLKPADYNANHDVLRPAREAVRAAKNELRAAVAAGREVRQGLGSSERS